MRQVFLLCLAILCETALAEPLRVIERSGALQVFRRDQLLVSAICANRGDIDGRDIKSSYEVRPDGTKVWNQWSEVKDRRFRLEVAERVDGAVEITLLGQVDSESKVRTRIIDLDVPSGVLDGKSFERLPSSGENASYFRMITGVFGQGMDGFVTRFLATDGIIWDFNPLGPGDESAFSLRDDGGNQLNRNGVMAQWEVDRRDGFYRFSSGEEVRASFGGFTGSKLVIRAGTFDDYHKLHFMRTFHYHSPFIASHLLAFGSPAHGPAYGDGHVMFLGNRGYGWTEDILRDRRSYIGHSEGAYYSAIGGQRDAVYRFDRLADGYYVVTFKAGNFKGVENRFSLTANAENLLSDATVPTGVVRTVVRVLHIKGGKLDLRFTGKWLVSVLGLQPLLGDEEDFSISRGFWVVDGYEPCTLFRNVDTAGDPVLGGFDETEVLPMPGTECAAVPREPPAPFERPSDDAPGVAWTKTAKMKRLLANSCTLAEFDEPGSLERFLDREWKDTGAGAAMLSGMHSRHTYRGHIRRGIEAIRKMTNVLHSRGIRVVDHEDATLLWNVGAGFRVMIERIEEVERSISQGLSCWQFCPCNPTFRETYMSYLAEVAKAGVDGFQIDELDFWRHGCVCRHCRDAFRRDVGWEIPLNELDRNWTNPKSSLRRRWHDWRVKTITNWSAELRRRTKAINPNLVLSNYTTNDAFYRSLPVGIWPVNMLDQRRVLNYFGIEMMTRSVMRNGRNLFPLARAQNILSGPNLAPGWTWYYNVDWPNEYFAWALSTMVGQTPLLSGVPSSAEMPQFEKFGMSAAAMKRLGAVEVAEVVLLYSTQSRDWNEEVMFCPETLGTAQVLESMHVPYRFICDEDLGRGVPAGTKVLFIGEAQCLTDAEIGAVKAFAAHGGVVRLSTRAGTRDAFGMSRGTCPFEKGPAYVYADTSHGAPFELKENWWDLVWVFDPDRRAEAAFREEIAEWTSAADSWRIDAPEKVFTSVWREADGAFVIHFLNATGVNMKKGEKVVPEAPSPAFPEIEKDISICAPILGGGRAIAWSPDFSGPRPLSIRQCEKGVRITLPRTCLKTYTLVRLHSFGNGDDESDFVQ